MHDQSTSLLNVPTLTSRHQKYRLFNLIVVILLMYAFKLHIDIICTEMSCLPGQILLYKKQASFTNDNWFTVASKIVVPNQGYFCSCQGVLEKILE